MKLAGQMESYQIKLAMKGTFLINKTKIRAIIIPHSLTLIGKHFY